MEYLFSLILPILFFSCIGLGPTFLCLKSSSPAGLWVAPVTGLSISLLAGRYFSLFSIPVENWAGYFTVLAAAVSFLIVWILRPKDISLFPIAWPRWLTALPGAAFFFFVVASPALLGDFNFSALRGNLYDNINYVSSAVYLDHYSLASAANLSQTDALQFGSGAYLFANYLTTDRISDFILLAYTAHLAQQPVFSFSYSFSVVLLLCAAGPVFLLCKESGLHSVKAYFVALAVCAGFWAQIVLDLKAQGQLISLPILLSLLWLVSSRNWISKTRLDLGISALMAIWSIALFEAYPEILPTFLLSLFTFIFIRFSHRQLSAAYLKLMGTSGLISIFLFIPFSGSLLKFFTSQISNAVQLPRSMNWAGDWFQFIFSTPAAAGFLGLSYFYAEPFKAEGWLGLIISIFSAILALYAIFTIYRVIRKSIYTPVMVCLAACCVACLLQFIFLLSVGNYWAAIKGYSYGVPALIILIGTSAGQQANLPKTNPKMVYAYLSLAGLWIGLQVFFAFFRISQISLGRTYFNTDNSHHRSSLSVGYDPDISSLIPFIRLNAEKTIWVYLSNIWSWEYLSLLVDTKTNLVPLLGITHNDDQPITEDITQFFGPPDYLIVDKTSFSKITAVPLGQIIVETPLTMLIKPESEIISGLLQNINR